MEGDKGSGREMGGGEEVEILNGIIYKAIKKNKLLMKKDSIVC